MGTCYGTGAKGGYRNLVMGTGLTIPLETSVNWCELVMGTCVGLVFRN
jgi:hypothetical protein